MRVRRHQNGLCAESGTEQRSAPGIWADYVDINNCPFAPQLLNRGFAKDTGLYKESGFCSYPLWTFDETVLKETGGEKYERYARAYDEYMESSFIGMMGAEDETGEEICTGMMM